MDGFAVVEALRHDKARTTPLIVYSGRDLTEQDRHELSLGMTRYLTKARTNESDFVGSVRELLNGIMGQARQPPPGTGTPA
jgi:CheY-like chemotaxis protein